MKLPQSFVLKHLHAACSTAPRGTGKIGNAEKHFGLLWRIHTKRERSGTLFFFECVKRQVEQWCVHADIVIKLVENNIPTRISTLVHKFHGGLPELKPIKHVDTFLPYSDGGVTLNFEVHVTINEAEGVWHPLRNFDESVERFSDVKLMVQGQKFYVLKKHLAAHSPVFYSMFFGQFVEAGKSEIELNDVDPYDFQKFLEVINGEPAVNDDTVEEILKLADFFQSETAVRSCEEFLIRSSEKPIKMKFQAAIKHKMNRLKEKCYSEMKTAADIQSVLPEDIDDFDKQDYVDLIRKAAFLNQDIDLI